MPSIIETIHADYSARGGRAGLAEFAMNLCVVGEIASPAVVNPGDDGEPPTVEMTEEGPVVVSPGRPPTPPTVTPAGASTKIGYVHWDQSLTDLGVAKPSLTALRAALAAEREAAGNPPIEQVRAAARAQIVAYADALTARITSRYPAAEVASWPSRALEAYDVAQGAPEAITPIITGLAALSGQTRAEIAQVIRAKAASYTAIVIAVTAMREQGEAAIAAAKTPDQVAAALAQLRADADAKAAELGLA